MIFSRKKNKILIFFFSKLFRINIQKVLVHMTIFNFFFLTNFFSKSVYISCDSKNRQGDIDKNQNSQIFWLYNCIFTPLNN